MLLIITDSPPCGRGVGQLYLASLLECLGREPYALLGMVSRGERCEVLPAFAEAPLLCLERRYEYALRIPSGGLGMPSAAASHLVCFRRHLRGVLRRSAAYARRIGVTRLLVVLDSMTNIFLAVPLARRLGVPLTVLVWDDPRVLAARYGLPALLRRWLVGRFGETLRAAERAGVMSQAMKDAYEGRYGVTCIPIPHGLPAEWLVEGADTPADPGQLRIGFSGSVTAPAEMDAFLRALDSIGWSLDGRAVSLHLTGADFRIRSAAARRIEIRGVLPTIREVVQFLGTCDMLYLPQPLDPRQDAFPRYSFPAKVTTYLAAGRPILLHAPEYSALVPTMAAYGFGRHCGSSEPSALLGSLGGLIEAEAYRDAVHGSRRAFRELLTTERMAQAAMRIVCSGQDAASAPQP